MSYALVQSQHSNANSGSYGSASSTTLVLPGNTTIGDILFFAANNDHSSATALTPSGLGTWVQIGTTQLDSTDNQDARIWFCAVTSAGTTVTATVSGGAGNLGGACMALAEFSSTLGFAASPLHVSDTTKAFASTTTGTDAEASNNISPTAGDLVIAVYQDGSAQGSIAHGTGWTTGVADLGGIGITGSVGIEFESAAGGSQNGTFTVGTAGNQGTVQIAAFSPAPVASTGFAVYIPVAIPTKFVGPQALRFQFHRSQQTVWTPEGAPDQTQPVIPIRIPNGRVGPQALRQLFRQPFLPNRSSSVANTLEEDFTQAEVFAVTKAVSIIRAFTQSQAFTVVKAITKTPFTWTQNQAVTLIRAAGKFLSIATQGETGTETRSSGKNLSATQGQSYSAARAVAAIRAWTQGETSVFVRLAGKFLSIAQGETGTESRSSGKNLAATQTESGALTKAVSKKLATVTQSQAVTFLEQKVKLLTLAFTQASAATMQRAVAIIRLFTQSEAFTATKAITKAPIVWAQSQVLTLVKAAAHALGLATQGETGSESRQGGKLETVTQATSSAYQRAVSAVRVASQSETPSLQRALAKTVVFAVTQAASLGKTIGKLIRAVQAAVVSFIEQHFGSQDIRFKVGQPVVRWSVGQPVAHWSVGQPVSKWGPVGPAQV